MLTPIKELRSFFVSFFLALFLYSFYSFNPIVIVLWLSFFALLLLFHTRNRQVPSHPLAILSPVDGTLLFTQAEKIPFFDVPGIHARIEKSFYQEQNLYSPIEGLVKEIWFPHSENSRNKYSLLIETDEKDQIILQLEKKGLAYTQLYVQPGQRVGQGRKIGLCIFSHMVDIFIPENANIPKEIKKENIKAAESVLAELIHEE